MSHFSAIRHALHIKHYEEAERLAIDWLLQDKLAAQGWVFLGEALLRQGQGAAARFVFQRAALLDPQAQWITTVKDALEKIPRGIERPDIERLLATERVSVAAAIITYNEERSIQRCIESLLTAVDEIVVLDSASTDRTLAIVAQYPQVKVVENVGLDDDFAAKRNRGLKYIDSDWVLWIDADEWLHEEDILAVREAAGLFHRSPVSPVLNICLHNHVGDRVLEDYSVPRLFPLRRGLRYVGRVHEQIVGQDEDLYSNAILRRSVRIRIHHDGYQPEIVNSKDKLTRNIRLLQRMIEEDPTNPGWWLYYGRETLNNGERDKALELLLEAERRAELEPRFGRMTEIHSLLIGIYISQEEYDHAEAVCHRALKIKADFPDARYWLAHIRMHKATLLLRQAEADLQQSKRAFQTYRGIVPADRDILAWKSDVALADLARLAGKPEQAKSIYRSVLAKYPELDMVRRKLDSLNDR